MKIHPTAIVHPAAKVGSDVEIGPYTIVEEGVEIGDRCSISAGCYLHKGTALRERVVLHPHCIIGGNPQDLRFDPATDSGVEVGPGTVLREGVTIHRSTHAGGNTKLGANCYLMAYAHVAHDCLLGNDVIMCNGALLAGHISIGDRVFMSGNSALHQFCRVGRLAMIGGLSRSGSDVPPFMILELDSTIRGVNVVGLRRAGFTADQIAGIRQAYKLMYHSGLTFRMAYEKIEQEVPTAEALEIVKFCRATKRGVARHFQGPPSESF